MREKKAPEVCPVCGAGADKVRRNARWRFSIGLMSTESVWLQGVDESNNRRIYRANFTGECTEVGMYLAMSQSS